MYYRTFFQASNLFVVGVLAAVVDALPVGEEVDLLTGGVLAQVASELTDPQVLHVDVDLQQRCTG